MSAAHIEELRAERSRISILKNQCKKSMNWHNKKAEELIAEATQHINTAREKEAELAELQNKFFNAGTELEQLTGKKRIEYLR